MKFVALLLLCGLVLATLVGVYAAGVAVGLRRNYNNKLRDLGLNRRTVALLPDAAALINRLAQTNDMSGLMAGDALSPETRAQAQTWAARYQKEAPTV